MHSSLNRAQAVFSFFTTVAIFIAGFTALSVLLYPTDDAKASVQVKDVRVIKGRPHYYSMKKEEYAHIKFDLDADLSPLFNWNTKQLFVFVLASYSSSDNEKDNAQTSQSIIWDTIIPAPESPYSFNSLRERFLPSTSTSTSSSRRSTLKQKSATTAAKSANIKKDTRGARPGVLRLRNQRPKYQISDITGRMSEKRNVTLSVGWNVQPWVGGLWWGPASGSVPHTAGLVEESKRFDFPALKERGSQSQNQNQRSSVA
ncbi:hypothetical protein MPDQ_008025 [Monascus purpureus]|uniref:Signal peptidase subunit 3 n=1 Tax=Monascus purpureus TaxID=5098 RepID=A0A507QUV5_MONPU|nr:hypothetical protein MPDQ_008025 [Monascus purpureus]BDD58759.1 hypothetical protein MAP00_004013 [Monascus purpureus]